MPRKLKRKSSALDVPPQKTKRGRPRKIIAPEALSPFEVNDVITVGSPESPEENLKPAAVKPTSRRMNPATSERCYSSDEVEFMNALADFKRASGRTFPTCSEILNVLRSLGYEKQ